MIKSKGIVGIFAALGLLSVFSINALADNGCPLITDSGSEIQVSFVSGSLSNSIKLGYSGEIYSNTIKSSLDSKVAEANISLEPNGYFYQLISVAQNCDSQSCSVSNAPIEVRRYRLGSNIAMIRYLEGDLPVTTVVNFEGLSPVVQCFGTNTTTPKEIEELFASVDLSNGTEQFASSVATTCSDSEICPSIFPYSFIFTTSDNFGENFRTVTGYSKAQFWARRGLRTSGLNQRKNILKLALKELESFVITNSYRAGSSSFKRSVGKSIALARRSITPKAGPKQVRAALLLIKGR